MNKYEFLFSSHIGWWVLKSPSHSIRVAGHEHWLWALFLMYWMTFHTPSEVPRSLYMFISSSWSDWGYNLHGRHVRRCKVDLLTIC